MAILIELKQCEPWPAWSLGGQLVNSDEDSWKEEVGRRLGVANGDTQSERLVNESELWLTLN